MTATKPWYSGGWWKVLGLRIGQNGEKDISKYVVTSKQQNSAKFCLKKSSFIILDTHKLPPFATGTGSNHTNCIIFPTETCCQH